MSDNISSAWTHLQSLPQRTLAELFEGDDARVDTLSARIEWDVEEGQAGILFDWSKTHLDADLIAGFEKLAKACDFAGKRTKLFGGEIVNVTEGRAATHSAMRGVGDDADAEEGQALLARMGMLVEAIHGGALGEVEHLIHIGIGGSALGPALAVDALTRDLALVDVHVVSNIDGVALEAAF